MKKYKLLKDLPLAKAGTIVTLRKSESASNIFNENNDRIYAIIDNTDINEWLEEITEKPKSVWDLKVGDIYYTFDLYSSITKYRWEEDGQDIGKRIYGFCFRLEEEAIKELNKRKAIQKIKKYCWENNIETEYSDYNNIVFTLVNGFICYNSSDKNGNPLGYFNSLNTQKILDNFKEELKIILN